MKLPKELTKVTPLSKFLAFILFITLPILFFFIGMNYRMKEPDQITFSVPTRQKKPTVPNTLQQPYAKVSIKGVITRYDTTPAQVDGASILKVQIPNGIIFEITLPAPRSSCTITAETNNTIQSLKVGNTVEVYGTAAPNERITVCNTDEFVKILP